MSTPVLDMILRSGLMGRIIISMLMILSLITWAIIFNRFFVLSRVRAGNGLFRRMYESLKRVSDIENMDKKVLESPMAQMGRAGASEYRRILEDARSHTAVKDWSFFLQNQFTMAQDKLESIFSALIQPFDKGVFLLAMISSIAPFMGLLGTVWGIMNSFYEIGNQGSASLPVVAPGIAEALITTIVGLAVAIPALFFYNYFNHRAERIENEMDEFKDVLLVRVKREIFNLLYTERPSKPSGIKTDSR
ncbi:MAG TPA: MotA/TolQ/ExbB proton channel family protein [Chitinispirillaceae bacterium]|nr:MotA/TolQ/ExbB proton channel family protein [Chitinispirillaceae bacterium]